MRRLPAVLAALTVLLPGCALLPGTGADEAAEAFAAAWSAGDDAAAAGLTDDSGAAAEVLTGTRAALDGATVAAQVEQVRDGDERADASLALTWDLGPAGAWTYLTELELTPSGPDGQWRVRWAPSVVHPQLAPGQRLDLAAVAPAPGRVLDRAGAPLLAATPVVTVLLDPGAGDLPAVAGALADALSPLDPAITEQSVSDGAEAAPGGQAYPVAVLRENDYRTVAEAITDLPGVRFTRAERLLAPDAGFATQILRAVRTEAAPQLDGVAGWSVRLRDAAGALVATLAQAPSTPGTDVAVGLDRALQAAAEDAVEPPANPAMLVAVAPSTGALLAVAQNAAADAQGPLALTGRYPPGSTFKIVTAAAAIEEGLRADSPVACPALTTIGGRPVPNIDDFDLGTVPLTEAFARSCNTTFAEIGAGLQPGALPAAALGLGLGADYDIAGILTGTGSVPAAPDPVQRAEDAIGQGRVLASPLGMALVAATVAHGAPVVPTLLADRPTEVLVPAAEPDPVAVAQLPPMMRAVVTDGTAAALAGQGEVFGKTGTAEYGTGSAAHGWFVGYRGDVAVAVLVVDGGSAAPAVEAAGRFLSDTG